MEDLGRCERHGGLVQETTLKSMNVGGIEELWCVDCVLDAVSSMSGGTYTYEGKGNK